MQFSLEATIVALPWQGIKSEPGGAPVPAPVLRVRIQLQASIPFQIADLVAVRYY